MLAHVLAIRDESAKTLVPLTCPQKMIQYELSKKYIMDQRRNAWAENDTV